MDLLSQISFGAPWLLMGLLALPVLWLLLRVTPPAPRTQKFPPLRLLLGLVNEEETPAKTPWWLLLLRLVAAALLIVALADPIIGRGVLLSGNGPLVLVVDNGWTAAEGWDGRGRAIADLLHKAGERPVLILETANPPSSTAPPNLLNAGEAERVARGLQPMPWAGDRAATAAALARWKFNGAPAIFWLSDGIEDGSSRKFLASLRAKGTTILIAPQENETSLGLLPPSRDAAGFTVAAVRAATMAVTDVEVAALGTNGETLAATTLRFNPGMGRAEGKLALPLELRNRAQRVVIRGHESAGAVQLLDTGNVRRRAGIVASSGGEQSLLADAYYLERALAPYAEVSKANVADLIARKVSVMVLADIGRIAGDDAPRIEEFVKKGGVLIRFAGEHMAQGTDALVPVPLRVGERYLAGAMAWGQPQRLASFGPDSPFNGLSIPPDVTISRQVLAEPSAELQNRAWARLTDGTPLVTAKKEGNGWIVLFHTSASPAWSTLPISGLYVDMLRRVLALAGGAPAETLAGLTTLPPVGVLNGFGHQTAPGGEAMPIAAKDFAGTEVSRSHPPGLYGAQGVESALNTLGAGDALLPMPNLGVERHAYGEIDARALMPWLLAAAATLLLLDAILSLALRGHSPVRLLARATGGAMVALLLLPSLHDARADDAMNMAAALDTRLAFVKTGIPELDNGSRAGLTGLGMVLKNRTAYEPKEPLGVDLERDDLSFYPLLYWPMDPRQRALSARALARVSDYMRQGGTILFDTRDLSIGAPGAGQEILRRVTRGLDIPRLEHVPGDHVLTRSFYILKDFPGRWTGAPVWVEALPPADRNAARAPARGGDGVSPVIIGGNDFAAAWAIDGNNSFLSVPTPGGENQREMAFRFGINVVMYALTGNYKTDQVHAPALLQRLGRER
jgi:hypothetical protein